MRIPNLKLVLVCVFISLLSVESLSQSELFGLKSGLNISNFRGNDADGLTPRPGFHLGIFSTLPLSDVISLQPEIMYSVEGNRFKDDESAESRFSYLNISPLLFKIFPDKRGFNFQTGIQIGVLLNATSVD